MAPSRTTALVRVVLLTLAPALLAAHASGCRAASPCNLPDCDQPEPCPDGSVRDGGDCVPDGDAGPDGSTDADAELPEAGGLARDILATALVVDVSALEATAVVTLGPARAGVATLEVGDLTVLSVESGGEAVEHEVEGGLLHLALAASEDPVELTVVYRYRLQGQFEGAMASGVTLTWPYYCGNLFPCHSAPADGALFELRVDGVPEGSMVVHPAALSSQAPAYMLAWAVGDYQVLELGTTAAGTRLRAWHRAEEAAAAASGTVHLLQAFEWLETVLGPYPFGPQAGAVAVGWGAGAYGGMEHHPFWHVSASAFGDEEIHVHEAAHGWYGNGVRIRCWEDFVLSEGTVSYLTAVTLAEVAGEGAGEATWDSYERRLSRAMATQSFRVAWPDSCGEVDILAGLFSDIPYMKGALFLRAVEGRVGREALVAALASFFGERVGSAAGMDELLDSIAAATGFDPSSCAELWLRRDAVPSERVCP